MQRMGMIDTQHNPIAAAALLRQLTHGRNSMKDTKSIVRLYNVASQNMPRLHNVIDTN